MSAGQRRAGGHRGARRAPEPLLPPVAWRPAPASGSTTILTLSLVEEPGRFLPAVVLAWSATVDGEPKTMPELPRIMLYEPFVLERETHDPAELARAIRTVLTDWFGNSAIAGSSSAVSSPRFRSRAACRWTRPRSVWSCRCRWRRPRWTEVDAAHRVRGSRCRWSPGDRRDHVTSLLDDPASRSVPSARGKVVEFNREQRTACLGMEPADSRAFSLAPVRSRVFVRPLHLQRVETRRGGNFLTP